LVGAVFLAGQVLGTQSLPQYDPGQAGRGEQILHRLDVVGPPSESVLIQPRGPGSSKTTGDGPGGLAGGAGGGSAAGLVSVSGGSALVTFKVAGPHADADATVVADQAAVARVQAAHPDLIVAEAGDASADSAGNALLASDFHMAELTSVPVTLILLLVVFGALIAAGIPVVLAGSAVTGTISLLAVFSRWLPIGSGTAEVVLILGMAVGVDYSLFYLRREREERAVGRSAAEALQIAAATSGRAIVISGLTVPISLAGLLLSGIDLFTGMAVGMMIVVGVTVAGSVTVLPALLALLGDWADRGRIPFLRRRTAALSSRLWAALVRRVVRHPLAWGGIPAIVMLALAAPAVGLRVGNPVSDLPGSLPAVQTLDKISLAFPGRPAPAEVVVTGQDLTSPRVQRAVVALEDQASASGPIRGPVTATAVAGDRALIISVPLAGSGSDSVSDKALVTLRTQVLPETLGKVGGVAVTVTGSTAVNHDWSEVLHARTPVVLGVVAGLAFSRCCSRSAHSCCR
jgi:putative drug exporter of the RND superfamily